ncbi:hypothetical protein ACQ4LE_001770 [Meloidogyne hapla]|uniref:MADF domain-containing protein n=1 Tax=Meloidogyne hapla TaxID=6305 RepID=A0A1I8AXY0_MELHA
MAPATIPSCCLTAEQKDTLIDAVHERPVIWDCSIPDYQDVQNRRAAFAEVAEILSDDKSKYSGPEMQVEWKKLRDIFNRTLKKVVANGGSDSEITWRYWQKLQFIADHERTQIYKAMQKWSKKVPSTSLLFSSPNKSNINNLKRKSLNNLISSQSTLNINNRFNKISDEKITTTSMVQQLAEVAQTARELLGIETKKEEIEEEKFKKEEKNEEEKYKLINEDGEIIEENEKEEKDNNNNEEQNKQKINKKRKKEFNIQKQQRPIDTIGQMLLLGSQLQNSSSFNDCSISNNNNSTTITELNKDNNNDLPKLLNELLSRGTEIIETNKESSFGKTTNKWPIKNEEIKRPRIEEELKNEWNYCNNNNIKTEQQQKQINSSDQFDIFGMFIASQLRTLHNHSPQSAFTLKRALTELCFQFEAEQKESDGKNKFNF